MTNTKDSGRKMVSVHTDVHKLITDYAWKRRIHIMDVIREAMELYDKKHKNDPFPPDPLK